jgi:ligand-binding sensor domain-containing protein
MDCNEQWVKQSEQKRDSFSRYQHDPKNTNSISSNNVSTWIGTNIVEDNEGNLWIATDKGLNKLNRERTAFTTYKHDPSDANSLSADNITSLLIDSAGISWVGTWNGKLNKSKPGSQIFWAATKRSW